MKKIVSAALAAIMLSALCACGDKPVSQTGENIVENTTGSGNKYDVQLDERTEDTQYEYGEDDLSLVDTMSGSKITLGMSQQDIETITGAPEQTDRDTLIYDGVIVMYEEGRAVSFIVSNGMFKDGKETRYKTTRGIGVGTSADDFKKAYGDSYAEGGEVTHESGEVSKTASSAIRYFKKDGNKIEFLGTDASSIQQDGEDAEYYLQDFMFSNKTGNIATMRISLSSAATGGMQK